MPPAVCRDTARWLPPCCPLSAAVLLPAVCLPRTACCLPPAARGMLSACRPPLCAAEGPPIPPRRLPRSQCTICTPPRPPRSRAARVRRRRTRRRGGSCSVFHPSGWGCSSHDSLLPRRVASRSRGGGGRRRSSRVVCRGALPPWCVCVCALCVAVAGLLWREARAADVVPLPLHDVAHPARGGWRGGSPYRLEDQRRWRSQL